MDSEQLEVIQLLDKDIDLLKKGIREERYKLPDVIKNSFSDAQIADPNMLDLFVDLLQLSQQHLNAPQSRATSRDKSLQAWPVLEVVPDTRPSPLLVQCRHCGRMLRAEVFHDHVTGCQQSRGESRAESRGNVNRTRDNSPAPRQEDSEDSMEERSRDHVIDRASQDLTRDMSQVARDLSPLARELVKKIGAEHSKRKRDDTEDEGPKSKKRKLSNEPATLPKKEIATTIEVTPPVTHQPMSIVDTWTAEEHDDRTTLKKLLMSKNSNQSSEEHVKELLEFIKSVPPRPLVFTNDDDALYFWHQSRTQSTLPVATSAPRDRRAHRLRGAGVTVQSLPSSELTHSVYRYTVPNRQLKLTAQQVLLQQTVKIALLSGLLHQNDPNTGNKQLRSSKGRVRANNSTTATPPPSAAATPSTEKKSESVESEVDEKQLMAKLLQLEPNTTAANNSTSANNSINTSSVPPTANNSNNVTAVSTPVPVTTAPSTSIAVPATPVPAVTAVTPTPTAVAKTGHVPTLLVPNSALSATLKDMAMKSKTGPGVPLTAVTLLHPTQLQGANIKMQVKQGVDKSKQGKVPPLAQPKTAPPPTGVKATPAPVSVTPKQISPKPAVKQPPLLAKPVLDSALLTANRVVLPLTSANASLMRGANTNMAGRVVSSMPVVLTTAAKPLVAPPNAVVPPTVPAKKSTAKK